MPHRDRYLFVCTNRREDDHPKGSCAQKGSEAIVKALKAALLKRGAAARVRACSSSCLDLCEIGATIMQEPEHVAYGHVVLSDVDEIAEAADKGEVVERLVVPHPGPKEG
jgi:(2Fe-2S) ferredoxin